MTPDRHDETPAEDAEHGVLADAGTVETSGLGFLDTGTAQVRVVLPMGSEDDLVEDDDVVVDEVHIDEVATGDIILEDIVTHPELPQGEVEDADEVDEPDHAVTQIAAGEPVDEADGVDAATPASSQTAAPIEPVASDEPVAPAEAAPVAPAAGAAASAPAEPAPAASAPTAGEPAAPAITRTGGVPVSAAEPAADAAVAVGAPVPLTGAIPTTRRAAHQASEAGRIDRAHEVERVHPPQPELTLASKRLGEFADGRESPDLLTADRLLDRSQLSGAEPEGRWQHFVYSLSRHRINLGDGKRARARKELDRRIASPLPGGARFVPVLSRKGGVGKTTTTTLLGMALADARDDRVIAVDANPDRGTLADRVGRPSGRTVRDLVRARDEVSGFNDISTIVARDETRLDVLASDADPRQSEAFSDRDYQDVATVAAHYYSIVLTDTGTGIVHSVMGATLDLADAIVVVAGLSVDEARLASETLTWLETNGYSEKVRDAVVVINNARPGVPLVRESELEAHFRTRVRAVIRMPYDPLIGTGSAITFRDLQPATRQAARELAAAVVEGLRALTPAA